MGAMTRTFESFPHRDPQRRHPRGRQRHLSRPGSGPGPPPPQPLPPRRRRRSCGHGNHAPGRRRGRHPAAPAGAADHRRSRCQQRRRDRRHRDCQRRRRLENSRQERRRQADRRRDPSAAPGRRPGSGPRSRSRSPSGTPGNPRSRNARRRVGIAAPTASSSSPIPRRPGRKAAAPRRPLSTGNAPACTGLRRERPGNRLVSSRASSV